MKFNAASDSPFHGEATSAANYRVQNTFPREHEMMGLNYHGESAAAAKYN